MANSVKLGRPKGSSKEVTLDRILVQARHFFAERGFDQTTIKDVANAIGLSHAAMYSYFSSKQELYLAAVKATQALLFPHYAVAFKQESTLKERLTLIFKAMATEHDADSSITGLLAAVPIEMSRHSELSEALLSSGSDIMQLLEALFDEAKNNGEIHSKASTKDLVAVFLGGGVGVSLFQYGYGRDNLSETMNVFIELVNGDIFSKS